MKRIIVLSDEGAGNATLLESRHVFEIPEVRLVYTCPKCKIEFVFPADASSVKAWSGKCPICAQDIKTQDPARTTVPTELLSEALEKYVGFRKYVIDNQLPLKLAVVTVPRPEIPQANAGIPTLP
jgi:hypothetical protein